MAPKTTINQKRKKVANAKKVNSNLQARAKRIYNKLAKTYPDAKTALVHANPYELLVATILSAQCTDVRVNMVTPALFMKYPTPQDMLKAKPEELEDTIRSTGFFRNKTKSLLCASKDIVEKFGGEVPDTMEGLLSLHGVARKTANVVLGNVFGKNEGVVVDTHVARLAKRMGLSKHKNPVKIEQDLMPLFPRKNWTLLAHLLTWHGRAICQARKADCENCPVAVDCPKIGVKKK